MNDLKEASLKELESLEIEMRIRYHKMKLEYEEEMKKNKEWKEKWLNV